MKIVFLGNNDFSVKVLDALCVSAHELVGVVCSLDKPTGRGQKLEMCAVKKYALERGIPVLQYASVSREGEEDVRALNPDILVTASFGQMLRENILTLAPRGVVNVHGSLLPLYRGATPVQTALFDGATKTGVTIMCTDIGMDTGDILYQQEVDIEPSDTAKELFAKVAQIGAESLVKVLDNFEFYYKNRTKQDDTLATKTHLIKDSKIDWSLQGDQIAYFIRGNYDSSTAWCLFRGEKMKIGFATPCENETGAPAGEIFCANAKHGLKVACGNGAINIERLQPAGKKMMSARDYLNGARIQLGEVMQ